MSEKEIVSFRTMLSLANALTLSPFEVQQLVTRTEIVLDHLTIECDRLRDQNADLLGQLDAVMFTHNVMQNKSGRLRKALLEIRGLNSANAPVIDIVERALQEAGDE